MNEPVVAVAVGCLVFGFIAGVIVCLWLTT